MLEISTQILTQKKKLELQISSSSFLQLFFAFGQSDVVLVLFKFIHLVFTQIFPKN